MPPQEDAAALEPQAPRRGVGLPPTERDAYPALLALETKKGKEHTKVGPLSSFDWDQILEEPADARRLLSSAQGYVLRREGLPRPAAEQPRADGGADGGGGQKTRGGEEGVGGEVDGTSWTRLDACGAAACVATCAAVQPLSPSEPRSPGGTSGELLAPARGLRSVCVVVDVSIGALGAQPRSLGRRLA